MGSLEAPGVAGVLLSAATVCRGVRVVRGGIRLAGRPAVVAEVTSTSPSNTCRPAWIRVRLPSSRPSSAWADHDACKHPPVRLLHGLRHRARSIASTTPSVSSPLLVDRTPPAALSATFSPTRTTVASGRRARVMLAIRKPSAIAASITDDRCGLTAGHLAARCGGTLAATPMPLPSSKNRTSFRYRLIGRGQATAPRLAPSSSVTVASGAASSAARAARQATLSPSARTRRSHSPARNSTTSRAPRRGSVERPRLGTILTTIPVGVEEDHVDGKAHERRVDATRRGGGARPGPRAGPSCRAGRGAGVPVRIRDRDGLRDDPAVFAPQGEIRTLRRRRAA